MQRYAVIGTGLAGTYITEFLRSKNLNVDVYSGDVIPASRTATGLLNPVIGKRFSYTPEYKYFFDIATTQYAKFPECIAPENVFRILTNHDDIFSYEKRLSTGVIDSYVGTVNLQDSDLLHTAFKNVQKIVSIKHSCRIAIPLLLDTIHKQWESDPAIRLISYTVQESDITTKVESMTIRHNETVAEYEHCFICSGWQMMNWCMFDFIPKNFAKGQIITVDIPTSSSLPIVIIGGKYLARRADGYYDFGATHDWDTFDTNTNASQSKELCEILENTLRLPFHFMSARANVRSVVLDIAPVVGRIGTDSSISMLNGLGSRGALLAPALAQNLVDHILDEVPLFPQKYSLERLYK